MRFTRLLSFPCVLSYRCLLAAALSATPLLALCAAADTALSTIGPGYARNSINTVIFRKNALATFGDTQYAAYYAPSGKVVLAKRTLGSDDWTVRHTRHRGALNDAHNSISLMVDGAGVLHMAWNHHSVPLHYARGEAPGSLSLSDRLPMTGDETVVTYPEFYRQPNGDLLFFFRQGHSGDGDLVLNRYDVQTETWSRVYTGLLDGEGQRNAYWQATIDGAGTLHLSWVWRETGDVATNHDICYARSRDGGVTWERSDGTVQPLPITAGNAEYAARIPQGSALMNQTAMCADGDGNPYISNYWRPAEGGVPQYHLVFHDGEQWQVSQVTERTMDFDLSGGGTKRVPISRPQIVADNRGDTPRAYMLFRDAERGHRVSVSICEDLRAPAWRFLNLTDFPVDQWEPSYDTTLWEARHELHVFVQRVGQGDHETLQDYPPTPVSVLAWTP